MSEDKVLKLKGEIYDLSERIGQLQLQGRAIQNEIQKKREEIEKLKKDKGTE